MAQRLRVVLTHQFSSPETPRDACLALEAGTAARCQERAADFDWDSVLVPRMVADYRRVRDR